MPRRFYSFSGEHGMVHDSPRVRHRIERNSLQLAIPLNVNLEGILNHSSQLMCKGMRCGGNLKIVAAIEEPWVITKILAHLGLPNRAPPRLLAWSFDLFVIA